MKCFAPALTFWRCQVLTIGILVSPVEAAGVPQRGQHMVIEPGGHVEPPALEQQGQQTRSDLRSFVSPIAGCEGLDCVKQYVALPDKTFAWHDTHRRLYGRDEASGVNWTGYVLNMTSQRWITENRVDFPVWWHTVVVVVPANLEDHTWATMHVEFGHNTMAGLRLFPNRDLPGVANDVPINSETLDAALPELTAALWTSVFMATRTRAVAVSLFNALNQYETFSDDPTHQRKSEDEFKAYTWMDFMRAGAKEPERIMELPVAKSVVRCLDVVSAFTAAQLPSGRVTRFGVYGHSKLGMATWMAGAVDSRVKAIAPAAMLMGLETLVWTGDPSLLQQKHNPYDELQLWKGTREIQALYKIISPLNWMEELTVPKLVIMDTNDEWMDDTIPQVAQWWPELPEPKGLLFVEATHGTATLVTMPSASSFFRGIMRSTPMPSLLYAFNQSTGKVLVRQQGVDAPTSVGVHYASSCDGEFPAPSFLHSQWEKASLWEAPPGRSLRAYNGAGIVQQWTADLYSFTSADALTQLARQKVPGRCSGGGFIDIEFRWPEPGWLFKLSTPVFLVPL